MSLSRFVSPDECVAALNAGALTGEAKAQLLPSITDALSAGYVIGFSIPTRACRYADIRSLLLPHPVEPPQCWIGIVSTESDVAVFVISPGPDGSAHAFKLQAVRTQDAVVLDLVAHACAQPRGRHVTFSSEMVRAGPQRDAMIMCVMRPVAIMLETLSASSAAWRRSPGGLMQASGALLRGFDA